jgi:hypothetical protein
MPSSSCHVPVFPSRLSSRTWGWAVLRPLLKDTCKPQISPYRSVRGHRAHVLCRSGLVSMSVTSEWQTAFQGFVSCVEGCRCSIRIDIGFKSCDCPAGGLTSVSVVFAIHASVVLSQAFDFVSFVVQELPRASGPLFFLSEGFLCLLLVTMYESRLNSVSGFFFCNSWGLEEELAYQSTSLSCNFLLLVTLREVPDLSRRG